MQLCQKDKYNGKTTLQAFTFTNDFIDMIILKISSVKVNGVRRLPCV